MKKKDISLRVASPADAEALLAIYRPYVEKTAITFEYEVPSVAEFRRRIAATLKKYPYLVAVKNGRILGYAYTGAFVGRAAYDWSAETSIYVAENQRKSGLGKLLYQGLETISKAQHITNLNACIGYPVKKDPYLDKNSVEFHGHLGFRRVGTFHKCGRKFQTWYDMVWMEKMLGRHPAVTQPVIPFSKLVEGRDYSL